VQPPEDFVREIAAKAGWIVRFHPAIPGERATVRLLLVPRVELVATGDREIDAWDAAAQALHQVYGELAEAA
jgi:hypothetical protein